MQQQQPQQQQNIFQKCMWKYETLRTTNNNIQKWKVKQKQNFVFAY